MCMFVISVVPVPLMQSRRQDSSKPRWLPRPWRIAASAAKADELLPRLVLLFLPQRHPREACLLIIVKCHFYLNFLLGNIFWYLLANIWEVRNHISGVVPIWKCNAKYISITSRIMPLIWWSLMGTEKWIQGRTDRVKLTSGGTSFCLHMELLAQY